MSQDSRTERQRKWDERYSAAEGGLFGDEPNDYLRLAPARFGFSPKSALFLADGDGRNGTWLASRGINVTGIDYSAEASRRAEMRDVAAGVTVRRINADLEQWAPAEGETWQAAFIFYLNGPDALRRCATRVAVDALAPGGWLIIESFSKQQPDRPPEILWSLEELLSWVPDMDKKEALSGTLHLDEGPRHTGETHVIRYTGRKPI